MLEHSGIFNIHKLKPS